MKKKRILIYRRGGLGDTLLTFPVAEIFKRKGFEVHFVGNTDYLRIGKEVGFIDRFYSDIPLWLINFKLNLPKQNSPRFCEEGNFTKIVLFAKGNPLEDFKNIRVEEFHLINPFPDKRIHITRYYLRKLNIEGEPFSETLPLKVKNTTGKRYVVLHPGSGSEKKNTPLGFFINLYRTLEEFKPSIKPIFVLGEAEETLAKGKLSKFNKLLIEDLVIFARFLKEGAVAFVGNDSGITHLAAYLGVPTVALFGPTDPVIWKPLGPKVKVLYKGLPCSPCFPQRCKNRIYKECLDFNPREVFKVLSTLTGVR